MILYYHNLPYDVIFELNKETQLITDINNTIYYNKTLNHFNLNLFHERPMLRFIASWIPVPSGVTKSYRGYSFSVNIADDTITCRENKYTDYKYGGQMLGIKIYCDGQYQGYYTRLFPTQYASSPEITHSSELTNILVPDYLSKSYQTSEITIITGNPHVSNRIIERLITRNETLTNCNIWIDDDGYGSWYASIYANAEAGPRARLRFCTQELHSKCSIWYPADGVAHSLLHTALFCTRVYFVKEGFTPFAKYT